MAERLPVAARPLQPEGASLGDWFSLHNRQAGWAAFALLILLGGGWFYRRSEVIKAERAEQAYFQARRSAAAGNIPLAQSDLRKVATRYKGTPGGIQAAFFLAQLNYQQGKFKEGIAELKALEASAGKGSDFAAGVHGLMASGYEETRDFAAAAGQYKLAAEASRFKAEKLAYQAYQARAYMSAGRFAEAQAIWSSLASDEHSPFATEARLRLGELSAQPVKL